MWLPTSLAAAIAITTPGAPSNPFSYEKVGATEIEYTAGPSVRTELAGNTAFTVTTIIRVRGGAPKPVGKATVVQNRILLRPKGAATPVRVEGLRGIFLRIAGTDFDGNFLCDLLGSEKPIVGSIFEVFWSNGQSSRHSIDVVA